MKINTHKIGKYLELCVEDNNTFVTTGLLNLGEAVLVKTNLQNVIDDINMVYGLEEGLQ